MISANEAFGRWQYLRTDTSLVSEPEWTDFDGDESGPLDPDNTNPQGVEAGRALLFAPDTVFRFVADPGFPGGAELEFRVWDQTEGEASNPPSTVVDDSGGVAPFDTSSLSAAAFNTLIDTDTDGDGVINRDDIDDDNDGILDTEEGFDATTMEVRDSDGDGRFDHVDIDSDDDGITDNIEAQTTRDYIAPSGNGMFISDADGDGLDDRYDTTPNGTADGAGSIGLIPVDTDGLGGGDYIDPDSDNDGISDLEEAGHGATQAFLDAAGDIDNDGLLDPVDNVDGNIFGWDSNDEDFNMVGNFTLADSDGDVAPDRQNIDPLNIDFDFREALDTDGDNVHDPQDIDDDNDGILDVDEGGVPPFELPPGGTPGVFNDFPADYSAFLQVVNCLLYTSPSPRDQRGSRMPSSA